MGFAPTWSRTQRFGRGPCLCRSQVVSTTTCELLRWMHFDGKHGRRSRYIGEVLKRYRGADARDLKRIELVDKWTCLNVLEKENFPK